MNELLHLAPNVWPRNTTRDEVGVVCIAGIPLTQLAQEYGTPLFVIDEDDFRSRCRETAAAFGSGANVHYAAKAFLCSEVARWISEEGLCLDVCTGGELAVALHASFPPERITLHGNNKSVSELTAAVKAGVGHIVVDSMTEIERLDAIAGEAGIVQDVLVRLTVGVEAHTHEFISTAHEDQKFGLSVASGAAMAAVRRVFATDHLRLVGLHSHIGSQIFDVDGFELAAHRVIGLLRDVVGEFGPEKTAQIATRASISRSCCSTTTRPMTHRCVTSRPLSGPTTRMPPSWCSARTMSAVTARNTPGSRSRPGKTIPRPAIRCSPRRTLSMS